MDTLLDPNKFYIIRESDDDDDTQFVIEKSSIWLLDGDVARPSTDVTISKKLLPGVYQIYLDQNMGPFCKRLEVHSDELYLFSDSIVGSLLDEINVFWEKKDIYTEHNLIHKRGILLEGYPGTGKSSIISLLSNEVIKRGGVVFKVVNINNFNIYVDFVINSFRQIEPDTPIITIVEDVDKYVDSEEFLDFLDGKTSISHHVMIATTNNTTHIPDSFLRPSRLDLKIEVTHPNDTVREEYFIKKGVPEEDLKPLVAKSQDLSLADLKELYVSIYLLGYTLEEAVEKITQPRSKKNYNFKKIQKSNLGL